MDIEELKVEVDDLKLGMYVSRLDRPWLDSPFHFQGFCLEDIGTIAQIKDCCEHVFVDVEKTSHHLLEEISSTVKKTKPRDQYTERALRSRRRFRDWQVDSKAFDGSRLSDANAIVYEDKHDTEHEVYAARDALDNFHSVIEQTFDAIHAGATIDPEQIDHAMGAILDSMLRNPDALIWLARLGDPNQYTYRHCVNMSIWSVSLGRQIGLPQKDLKLLGSGAIYCDLGKAKVPLDLLLRDGPLSELEMKDVRQHVDYGLNIIENIEGLDPAILAMVAQHHESHDGCGYPSGLKKSEIDLYARMASIADSFDAMINTRPYRQGVPISEAIRELYSLRDKRFQPELMEEFIHAIGLYPAGTMVQLSTGHVGVVIGESRVRRLRPRVMLLLDKDQISMDHFPVIDLLVDQLDPDGNPLNIVRDFGADAYDLDLDPTQYFQA